MTQRPDDAALLAAWNTLATDREAKAIVYMECQEIATRVRVDRAEPEQREYAAALVLTSVHRRASREPYAFDSAVRVRRYLWLCLKRELVGLVKSRERPDGDVGDREDKHTAAPGDAGRDPAALESAIDALVAEVVEPCGRRRRAGRLEALREAVTEMVDLRLDRVTVAELVGVPANGPDFDRLRAAMYQRHSRARRELLDHLDWCERVGSARLDADAIKRYRDILDALRRRSAGGQ